MPKRRRARENARLARAGAPRGDAHDSSPSVPPAAVLRLTGPDEARALAEHLLAPGRRWPVTVISTSADAGTPYVDPDRLKHELGDLCEVVVLPTGPVSWAFSAAMPDMTQVYGGASRVYPVDRAWVDDPYVSTLRFAWSTADDERVRGLLARDALAAAAGAGLAGSYRSAAHRPGSAVPSGSMSVEGVVQRVFGARAFVVTDDGEQVTVAEELVVPGVPLANLLQPGQRVAGVLDPASRRLDVTPALPAPAASGDAVAAAYRPGDVVLARVHVVEHDRVDVELAPGVVTRVGRELVTGNDLDDLRDLFSVGETVLVRVVATAGGPVSVRLDDVDETVDVPLPALALLPGGPPWLDVPADPASPADPAAATVDEPDDAADDDDDDDADDADADEADEADEADDVDETAPVTGAAPTPAFLAARSRGKDVATPEPAPDPAPVPEPAAARVPRGTALADTQLALATARSRADRAEHEAVESAARATAMSRELAELRELVDDLQTRLERRDRQIEQQKRKYRNADRQRQLVTRRAESPAAGLDPEDALRRDVFEAWLRVVGPHERAERPHADYVVGPRFIGSLDDVEVSRKRVLDVVVHLITGRAEQVNGLQLHPLRSSGSGNAPQATRPDGARCWRVSLQVNAPSARRLHFWRLPDGRVELSRVVLHDDVDP